VKNKEKIRSITKRCEECIQETKDLKKKKYVEMLERTKMYL